MKTLYNLRLVYDNHCTSCGSNWESSYFQSIFLIGARAFHHDPDCKVNLQVEPERIDHTICDLCITLYTPWTPVSKGPQLNAINELLNGRPTSYDGPIPDALAGAIVEAKRRAPPPSPSGAGARALGGRSRRGSTTTPTSDSDVDSILDL